MTTTTFQDRLLRGGVSGIYFSRYNIGQPVFVYQVVDIKLEWPSGDKSVKVIADTYQISQQFPQSVTGPIREEVGTLEDCITDHTTSEVHEDLIKKHKKPFTPSLSKSMALCTGDGSEHD